jgi:hypothetical protein
MQEPALEKSKLILVMDANAKGLAGLHATFLLYLLSLPFIVKF